jgi:hypothetical protein
MAMSADWWQQQELEEYEQWLADPIAQKEYQDYLTKKENQKCNSKIQETEILSNHQSGRTLRVA